MKRVLITLLGSAFVMVATGAGELFAHHGRGETYISERTIEIEGTINRVLWRNPHVAIMLDVRDESGEVTTWTIEHSNVSTLARLGYGRLTLRPGMEVTAVIFQGTRDRPIGLTRMFILADGTEVFMRGGNDSDRYNPLADIN